MSWLASTVHGMRSDFGFLRGAFDITGRRLRDALDPCSGWADVHATCSALVMSGGAVSIDEMWFPIEQRFGLSLRLFDPASRTWTVRWLDGCGGLRPPAEGCWAAGAGWFTGPDQYRRRPVLAGYRWSDVTGTHARWERCFSVDGGRSWLPNLDLRFARRRDPVGHPQQPRAADDFDFLAGTWQVRHRRVLNPVEHALGQDSAVAHFDGVHVGRSFFAGAVSVDETTLAEPSQRGLTFRTYDLKTGQWSIYWVNSRVGRLEPPVHGRFSDGTGTFYGSEQIAGHHVQVRFVWSDITATIARWRQSFAVDGGDWDLNWEMTFTRPAPQAAP